MRRAVSLVTVVGLSFAAALDADAAPDPVIAGLLSAGSTVIPVAVGSGLLLTGRGSDEGVRFDIGISAVGIGAVLGPSVGQLYAGGGIDALVSFILRAITGAIMTVGIGLKLRGDEDNQGAGTALAVVGGIPTGLLAIYDVYAATKAAQQARYREGHAVVPERELERLVSIARCGPIPCR